MASDLASTPRTGVRVQCCGAGEDDPLFLQFKEARASVLEPYAGASEFPNHGQRVVNGYRLTQPASDMFLGWGQGVRD